jgi:hypothetical protein
MKKTMVFVMMMVIVFAFGSAFAAENTAMRENNAMVYNGITYFDLRPASTYVELAASKGTAILSYNGITYIDQEQSGAKGSAAGGSQLDRSTNKFYNGITVF